METKDIIKITALVFSKKKTIAQVSKEYKAIHGKELPIKGDLETLQAQLSLGGIYPMVTMNHNTLGELVIMLSAQIDAEYNISKTTHSNYVNAFNKKYQYLNNTLRIISGESVKGGTFALYSRNPLLVLSGLIMDKYKKILFTDIKGNTFIVNNVKWLYQYMSSKNINTEPRIYG